MNVRLSTLTVIIENAKVMDQLRPMTSNPAFIHEALVKMTDHQLGTLFRAIDEVCVNSKQLLHETVEVIDDRK